MLCDRGSYNDLNSAENVFEPGRSRASGLCQLTKHRVTESCLFFFWARLHRRFYPRKLPLAAATDRVAFSVPGARDRPRGFEGAEFHSSSPSPLPDLPDQDIFASRSNMSLACSSSTLRICSIITREVGSSLPSQRTISEYDSIAIRSATRFSLIMSVRLSPGLYSEWLRVASPSGLKFGSPPIWVILSATQSACCCSSVAC